MGLRHIVVVDGDLFVKGIITRFDMNEHRLAHYWEAEGEQMQKEMSIDTLPPPVAYEVKEPVQHVRRRSASVQSNTTVDTIDSEIDMEILLNDLEVSDSPNINIRKKFVA
jgi:hypothetical protein